MHLLQLVQRQLQAAQKQASLLEGKGNLYQSVNIPIKKSKTGSTSNSVYFFVFQTYNLTISPSNHFHYCKNTNQTKPTKSLKRL